MTASTPTPDREHVDDAVDGGDTVSGSNRPPDRPRRAGTVHVVLGPHLTRIVLAGDVDEVLSPQLLAAQRAALEAGSRVEVDVTEVTFMNSAGASFLGVLAARSPIPIALVRPSAEVRFLLELTHTAALMEIVDRPDPAPQRHLRMVRSVTTEPVGE